MTAAGNVRTSRSSSTFEWEIENYSRYNEMKISEVLCSPPFDVNQSSWCMMLYPSGDSEDSKGYISLFLSLYRDHGRKLCAQYTLSLIDSSRDIIATFTLGCTSTFVGSGIGGRRGRCKFVDRSLVVNDSNITMCNKVTIICKIVIEEVNADEAISRISSKRMQHFEGLKNWINNPAFSDVKFTVENKEILAHKIMLASSSKVFEAMFEHKMQENVENTVKVEDISYNIFNKLIGFIYTGECTLSKDTVSELFMAADKYQLLKLKSMCEEELCKNISNNNVIEFLQLADMNSAECLKKKTIEYIAVHGKEILDSPEFDAVGNLNLKLLKDVFRGIFARIK